MSEVQVHRTVDAVWKLESATIIGGLTRLVHDVGLAEELAQDALVAALERWPETGVPDNPGAWLTAIAQRRAVDHIRRARRLAEKQGQLAREDAAAPAEQDDVLRLIFLSCHPVLSTPARAALTLRLVGGLTTQEIARAFLTTENTITQRIAAAKRTLAEAGVSFELPAGPELTERLAAVLEVIYLVFNEGYSATSGEDLIRADLVKEALRLGRLLAELAADEPEVHGLVALMEIQASRSAARTGQAGEPIQLHEQNRGRWDQLLIRRGFTALLRARQVQPSGTPGPYVLQAAIAVTHAQARTAADTDWAQIAALYQALAALTPTPVVQLNRAVAVGMAQGPAAGLALVEPLLADPALQDYHLLPSVRGDLLAKLGRAAEAKVEFTRAAALTRNAAEREFLGRRAAELTAAIHTGPTLDGAAAGFLAGLEPRTAHSYGQTLHRLVRTLGPTLPIAALTADEVVRTFETAWAGAAPATWNRHRAALRSFTAWAGIDGAAHGIARRAAPITTARRSITDTQLDAVWRLPAALRERTLWRLLHESGGAISAVLGLDVEDLDLTDRRAWTGRTWVSWRSASAALLPQLIDGRGRGPVFLAERRPGPARARDPADRCPITGRTRLSYERAEYLFKQATKELGPGGAGLTLSCLRS